jgi:hypothetical protein
MPTAADVSCPTAQQERRPAQESCEPMSVSFRSNTAALGQRTVAPVGATDSGTSLPFTI